MITRLAHSCRGAACGVSNQARRECEQSQKRFGTRDSCVVKEKGIVETNPSAWQKRFSLLTDKQIEMPTHDTFRATRRMSGTRADLPTQTLAILGLLLNKLFSARHLPCVFQRRSSARSKRLRGNRKAKSEPKKRSRSLTSVGRRHGE